MSIIVNGVELTEVIYAGVNLDTVKAKKGTAEAVTVFEKITQLATPQNVTANGTTVSWDAVENATSYAVLADGSEIGTVENVTEDALAGTWAFNDVITLDSAQSFNLVFISGGIQGTLISIEKTFGTFSLYYTWENSNVTQAFTGGQWTDTTYKTINITSKLSEVTNGEELLTWLQANATKQ